MKTNGVISRCVMVIISFLFLITFSFNQSIAQDKGNAAYKKVKKLQKLLDLSDIQKAKVVDIIMSVNNNEEGVSNDDDKKTKAGNRTGEINTAIEQILTVEQATKFNEIKTTWFSKKNKKDSSDEDSTITKKDKNKKEKKSKKNKNDDEG